MLESTFLGDWDEIGTKMAKKGHLLPKSGINSELVSIQRVNKKPEFSQIGLFPQHLELLPPIKR